MTKTISKSFKMSKPLHFIKEKKYKTTGQSGKYAKGKDFPILHLGLN